MEWKLSKIVHSLCPRHPLLEPTKKTAKAKGTGLELLAGVTQSDDVPSNAPPYESLKPTKDANKHELLFWGGRNGPAYALFALRAIMLMAAVSCAVIYTWLLRRPEDIYGVLLAAAPVLHILLSLPYSILPRLVIATSIEQLRSEKGCNETLLEMKTEHTLRMLKLLNLLQAQAKRLQKLSSRSDAEMGNSKPRSIDPEKLAELKHVFDLFDDDGSGSIDATELGRVMKSMGMNLDEQALHGIYTQMDADGEGGIDFQEFAAVMGGEEEPATPEEIATQIFDMLDTEQKGIITEHNLVEALEKMNLPGLTRDDISAAMGLFNSTHEGIQKKDFIAGIEQMQTFN